MIAMVEVSTKVNTSCIDSALFLDSPSYLIEENKQLGGGVVTIDSNTANNILCCNVQDKNADSASTIVLGPLLVTECSEDSTAVLLSDIGIEEILENFELTQIDSKIVHIASLLGDIDLIEEIRGDPGFCGSIRDTDLLGAIDNDDQETIKVVSKEEELISETEKSVIVETIQYFVTSESQSAS